LRNNQLGIKFRRQHHVSKHIVDFYCHKLKLVIEIDGGYPLKRDQKEYDKFRATDLSNLGITILRFTNDQVEKNIKEVLHEIELQVAHRTPNPYRGVQPLSRVIHKTLGADFHTTLDCSDISMCREFPL